MIDPQAKKEALDLAIKLGQDIAKVNERAENRKDAEVVAQLGNVADAVLLLVNLLLNLEEKPPG